MGIPQWTATLRKCLSPALKPRWRAHAAPRYSQPGPSQRLAFHILQVSKRSAGARRRYRRREGARPLLRECGNLPEEETCAICPTRGATLDHLRLRAAGSTSSRSKRTADSACPPPPPSPRARRALSPLDGVDPNLDDRRALGASSETACEVLLATIQHERARQRRRKPADRLLAGRVNSSLAGSPSAATSDADGE